MAPPGFQEILVESKPEKFFKPPYVGHKGWVGVRLDIDSLDWDEVAGIVEQAYEAASAGRLFSTRAPKKEARRRTSRKRV
jgi:hypothetical protein